MATTSAAAGPAPPLARSNTIKSTVSTASSVHNPRSTEYWNNLICLFTGLGTNPQARAVTSLNNKDIFPGGDDALPKSSRPASRAGSPPKRSGSILRPSLAKKRPSQRSSFFGRKARGSLESTSPALDSVPETSTFPTETQMRNAANEEVLARIGSQGASSTTTAASFPGNMIPVIKDGQTLWLPESVVSQFLGGVRRPTTPPQIAVPRRSSLRRNRRPGMRISIPSQSSLPRPEDVCDAIPIGDAPSRPVHPLERESYRGSIDGVSPPGLASDRSGSCSPSVQSPLSNYDGSTSQSSLSEVQTPKDGSPANIRFFPVINPAVEGVFDEGHLFPSPKEFAAGGITIPIPPSRVLSKAPPALPERSRKRIITETKRPQRAKTINEISLALSPVVSAAASGSEASIGNDVAAAVIYGILSSTDTIEDLFHCALANKGFYSVYKRNEADLIKNVFALAKPAAEEAREQ